jgi:arylsulfatase A-like enzyme
MSMTDYSANFAEFLEKKPANQPFCFWYGGQEPHRAYQAGSGVKLGGKSIDQIDRVPAYWPDTPTVRSDMLDYAFEIEYFDQHLAKIIAAIEKAGQLDNTIIVVTADNGMPFPRSKGTTYEISNHMPLAIRWGAGIAKPGRRVDDYVSFIDFAPTFLDVAGVKEEASGMQKITGHSIVPILRDAAPVAGRVQPGRDYLLIGQERHDTGRPDDVGYPTRGIYRDGFLYLKNFEPSRWPMCDPITGYLNTDGGPTKTLILAQNRQGLNHWIWELNFGLRPAEELYDLKADPDCMVNVIGESRHGARREALSGQLMAELKAQGDPRTEGRGEVFDKYPNAGAQKDFYTRFMKGEKVNAGWVEPTDFEKAGFDPERPLRTQK